MNSEDRERGNIERIEQLAKLLDSSIPLGRSGYKIGLDPIIGLIPGLGDAVTSLISGYIILLAAREGVSRVALAKMILNVGIETFIGIIPIAGDLFDFVFKSNLRNLEILKSARRVVPPGEGGKRLASTLMIIALIILGFTVLALSFAILLVKSLIAQFYP